MNSLSKAAQKAMGLPFCLLLATTFGLAGCEKLVGGGVPFWFVEQFHGTLIDLLPGSLSASFYLIMLLESVTAILFVLAIFFGDFKPGRPKPRLLSGVWLAQISFVMLGFGQRLTHKYDSAAQLFLYAVTTLLGGLALSRESD